MIEGYRTEEVVECCQEYLQVQRGIGNPDSHHKGRLAEKGTDGRKTFNDYDYTEVSQGHYCVLQSTKLMKPYVDEHMVLIMKERNGRSDDWGHETTQATPNFLVEGPRHTTWRK
jgi:hypothetical protein